MSKRRLTDEEIDWLPGPPELRVPDGTLEERKAWWKAVIDRSLASGEPITMTPAEMAESVKRRGRERLARRRDAA
jgi:hypothetical protein